MDKVLDDETVTYPFTKQMCCVVTDGGGALVLTSRQRAASLARPPVYVLGSGESAESTMVPQVQDLGGFAGFRRASAEAFATASVCPGTSTTSWSTTRSRTCRCTGWKTWGSSVTASPAGFIADGHTRPAGSCR